MTKCPITCKSLQKSSECQNFLRVWHLVIFRADQSKRTPCICFSRWFWVSQDGPGVVSPSLLRKLEEQLKETQVAKDELVAQQQELHEMMIRFANLLLFVF